jgi:tubulin polyglutamylase TTLL9
MKLFLMSRYGVERVDALFWEIQMIILRSLLAVQHVMINDKHCFELYGYDVIIDQDLKPWLLEVNIGPQNRIL